MIDQKTIQHIAKLARLDMQEAEAKLYSEQLSKVLENFKTIEKIPTDGVEPMVTPSDIETFWREDQVVHECTAEEIVANAPSRQGNLFKVPPVV